MSIPDDEIPILDISGATLDATQPEFASDPEFFIAAQKRQGEMTAFMKAIKIQTMRTRLSNSSGAIYKVQVSL